MAVKSTERRTERRTERSTERIRSKLGPSGLGCRSALDPEGTLKVLTRKLSVLRVSAHEFVFFQFFAKKASQVLVKIKSELLDQKYLMSPTCCNFEIFDHDPQLDMKF